MKICGSCHEKYEDAKRYCRRCGAELVPEVVLSPEVIVQREKFEAALLPTPTAAAHIAYGQYLLRLGVRTEALEHFQSATKLDPNSADAYAGAAEAYRAKRDPGHAAAKFLLALEQRPNDAVLWESLSALYVETDKPAEAASALAHAISHSPDSLRLLLRQRDLIKQTGDLERLAGVCEQILSLCPTDSETIELLADSLLKLHRCPEALHAFALLQRVEPDHARAAFYQARARLLSAAEDPGVDWPALQETFGTLSSGSANHGALSPEEQALAILYGAAAALQAGERLELVQARVDSVHWRSLSGEEGRKLRAQLYLQLARKQLAAGQLSAAENAAASLQTPEVHLSVAHDVADVLEQLGEELYKKRQFHRASQAYDRALLLSGHGPTLKAKRVRAGRALKRSRLMVAGAVCAALTSSVAVAGLFYFGQQSLRIEVTPSTAVQLLRGETVLFSTETGQIQTPLLWFGSYTVVAEKEGYAPLQIQVRAGFGRGTAQHQFQLAPLLGSIRFESDTPSAVLSVNNVYEEKTLQGSGKLEGIFALPSDIMVTAEGFLPFLSKQAVPVGAVLDLGKIQFRGGVAINSDPEGAMVYIADGAVGTTPLRLEDLPARTTTLVLRKPGIGAYIAQADITPGSVIDLGTVRLSELAGLRVTSSPSGASVSLDGLVKGQTPLTLDSLNAGHYTLKVQWRDCTPHEQEVELAAGDVLDLGELLFTGGLEIDSEPGGAEVRIDGVSKGKTPLKLEALPARPTPIRLIGDKGLRRASTVVVPRASTLKVGKLRLTRYSGHWRGSIEGEMRPLFIKEGTSADPHELVAVLLWQQGPIVYHGTGSDSGFLLTGEKNWWADSPWSMKGRLTKSAMGDDVLTAQFHDARGAFKTEMTFAAAPPEEAERYQGALNNDLRYFLLTNDVADEATIAVNGLQVMEIGSERSSGWFELTPFLQNGMNRLRYLHERSGTHWNMDLQLRRNSKSSPGMFFGRESRPTGDDRNGQDYELALVLPYFDTVEALSAWQTGNGGSPYFFEYPLIPLQWRGSSSRGEDFGVVQALDNDVESCWETQEGKEQGETLEFKFGKPVTINGFRVLNGSSGYDFQHRSRLKEAELQLGEASRSVPLRDVEEEQFIPVEPQSVDHIRLRVASVYPSQGTASLALRMFQPVTFVAPQSSSRPNFKLAQQLPSSPEELGSGWTVVEHLGKNLLRPLAQGDTYSVASWPVSLEGDFAVKAELTLPDSSPWMALSLQDEKGLQLRVYFQVSYGTWHVVFPCSREIESDRVPDISPSICWLQRVGDVWSLSFDGHQAYQSHIPTADRIVKVQLWSRGSEENLLLAAPAVYLPDSSGSVPAKLTEPDGPSEATGGQPVLEHSDAAGATVLPDVLNLRAQPALDAAIVEKLAKGASLRLLAGPSDHWYRVQTAEGMEGWVHGDYIDVKEGGGDADSPVTPTGRWVGTWEDSSDRKKRFTLYFNDLGGGNALAVGSADGWTTWERFQAVLTGSQWKLTGTGVVQNTRPANSYALDTVYLKQSQKGSMLDGWWEDKESGSGAVKLQLEGDLGADCPFLVELEAKGP